MVSSAKVLLNGFEPFAGAKLNSSEEVVRWLRGAGLSEIRCEILPVEYGRSAERILSLIEEFDPQIIFSLGQAEGRSKVSFERIAVNLDDARIADNSGEVRRERPIIEGGQAAYMAAFPVRDVVEALSEKGHPVEESLSAGAFVCNHLFYAVSAHLSDSPTSRWMDFVHLPLVTEQGDQFPGKPTLPVEIQGAVIVDAIERARALWGS